MAAAAVGACSDATPAGVDGGDSDADADADRDAGLSVDEYCDAQARVLCDGYQACCDLESYDRCIEILVEECEAGEISSVRAGEATLDGVVAERCLDAYARAYEDCVWNEDVGVACRYRWYGDAAEGEACRDVWHCRPGLGCALDGTSGTCVDLPGDGESCEAHGACEPGFYCSYEDWLCHEEPGLGETCERPGICAAGECLGTTCAPVRFCD
jgi:hypothetical protein